MRVLRLWWFLKVLIILILIIIHCIFLGGTKVYIVAASAFIEDVGGINFFVFVVDNIWPIIKRNELVRNCSIMEKIGVAHASCIEGVGRYVRATR
jgi:hypothetical protein